MGTDDISKLTISQNNMIIVAFLLLFSLIQGFYCQQWLAFMPTSIDALSGSCVIIPCSFNFPSTHKLDGSCKAIWMKGPKRTTVFDSSHTPGNANMNMLQGSLMGNLYERDCTTVFYNITSSDYYNSYYFRLDCDNGLKYNYKDSVQIKSKASLPPPTVTPSRVEVEAGTVVTLSCSALSPCPILPPNLTWTPSLGDAAETLDTTVMTSVMNFTASPHHNSMSISCSALYNRQDGSGELSFEQSLTISVMHPPINTSTSSPGSVQEGSVVTLTCTCVANPNVNAYIWYQVDSDKVITVGYRKLIIIHVSEEKRQFYCEARNPLGTQNSSVIQIDVQFPPKKSAVVISPTGPIVEGSSLTLTCVSHANPAVTNYTWYKMEDGSGHDTEESGRTFTIDSASPAHSGEYFCVAKNYLGEKKSPAVLLDIHYPPRNTSVSADVSGPVLDGSSVTLSCRSVASPAVQNYTWYRVWGGQREAVGSEQEFSFNASKHLGDSKYYCEAHNEHGADASEPVSVNVTFAAEILPPSRCVKIIFTIKCSCESHGNPPPSVLWELAGEPVNHSAAIPVREEAVGSTGTRSTITLYLPAEDTPTLVCHSNNSMGFDSWAFNMSSSEIQLGYHTFSLLIGCAAGASMMMLLCGALQNMSWRKKKHRLSNRELVDNSELTYGSSSTQMDVVFANKAMVDAHGEIEEESLHYANVDFTKLQVKSREGLREGEIRGLSSRTLEYAQIRLKSKTSVGDAEDKDYVTF